MAEPRRPGTLLWGLLFALAAAGGAWTATGHRLPSLASGAPWLLIALGVLVALQQRHRKGGRMP